MDKDKKISDQSAEVKEEEQEVVIENAEETVCSPDFSSGCIDITES